MKFSKIASSMGFAHVEFVVAVVAVLAVGLIGVKVMTASHADTGASVCGSGYVQYAKKDMYFAGYSAPQASLQEYFNKGLYKKCVVLLSEGNAYGVSKPMAVQVNYTTISNSTVKKVYNKGNFKYYAGPIYVDNTNLKTWASSGSMTFEGVQKVVSLTQ